MLDVANTYGLNELHFTVGKRTIAALANVGEVDNSRKTVVFVHGYLDNANSFAPLIPLLHDYQCIAIDLAGHGKSDHRSEDAHYHLVDYAYDLDALISQLDLTDVVVVGHSLGAIVGSIYAATHPSPLNKLVLIESCGPLSESTASTASQIQESFQSRRRALAPIKHPSSLAQVVGLRVAVSDLSHHNAELIMRRNIDIQNDKVTWRTDKRLRTKSAMRMTEEQARNILSSATIPRVVILGDKGFEKVKRGIEQRNECFLNTQMHTFSGGHHVHLESTQQVADTILAFIHTANN